MRAIVIASGSMDRTIFRAPNLDSGHRALFCSWLRACRPRLTISSKRSTFNLSAMHCRPTIRLKPNTPSRAGRADPRHRSTLILPMTVESDPMFSRKRGTSVGGEGHGGERPIRRSWSGLHSLIGRG